MISCEKHVLIIAYVCLLNNWNDIQFYSMCANICGFFSESLKSLQYITTFLEKSLYWGLLCYLDAAYHMAYTLFNFTLINSQEVGMPADYVNKLARMFQDIKVSEDLNMEFKETHRNNNEGLTLSQTKAMERLSSIAGILVIYTDQW